MGSNVGSIAVRTDTSKVALSEVFSKLVSNNFKELFSNELYVSNNYKEKFDTRYDDCYTLYKTQNHIFIENSNFVSKFFSSECDKILRDFNNYFNIPRQIFAFEHYDFNNIFSYTMIENGRLIRQFKATQLTINYSGEPKNIETKWLELPEIEYIEDKEKFKGFIHPDNKRTYHQLDRYSCLFDEVFEHEVGLPFENYYLFFTETKYYRLLA